MPKIRKTKSPTVNIPIILSVKEVRAKLTDLLYDVMQSEITFIITKNGRPFAKLAPLDPEELKKGGNE